MRLSLFFLFSFLISGFCFQTPAHAACFNPGGSAAPATGLVGWWKLDEGSGTSAADSSGGGYTGTLTNGPTWTTSGEINGALTVAAASSQYVNVPDAASLRLSVWTVSAWVKLTSMPAVGAAGDIVDKYGGHPAHNYVIAVDNKHDCPTNLAWKVEFQDNTGSGYYTCYYTTINTGTWYHVAGTWDGTTMTLYLNGASVATSVPGAVPDSSSGQPLALGRDANGTASRYLDGTIDDARVYNRVLSAAEVAQLASYNGGGAQAGNLIYNSGYRTFQYCNGGSWQKMGGAGDTASNLVGWWKFDDGSGTSAADSSGYGITGTLVASPTWTTGMNNGALTFNGTTQKVDLGNPAALNNMAQRTIAAWIKINSFNATYRMPIVGKGAEQPDCGFHLAADGISGNNRLLYWECGYNDGNWVTANGTLTAGPWYHVAVTFTMTDPASTKLYINGVSMPWTQINGVAPFGESSYNMAIGGQMTDNTEMFNGTIDDVRIYNRALSAADVMTLYGSTGGSYPGTPVSSPTQGGTDACGIAGGALYCWGANNSGEDGTGDTSQHYTPAQVGSLTTWTSVTQADPEFGTSACGIAGGNLYCWGFNGNGELGLGNTTQYTSPQQVTSPSTTWTAVSSGGLDTCGITTAGALYCWGINGNGQLGLGNTTQYTSPQQVTSPSTTWTAVSTNGYATCGITTAGALYCWGNNNQGELGLGNYTQYTSPQQVTSPSTTWTAVSQGDGATCGITTGGALYCWGTSVGINSSSPQQVGSLTNWTAISVENDGSNPADACGIAGGKLYCWGGNNDGEDGLGNTTQYTTPQQVGSLTNWTAVSQGGTDTCGIAGGALYCWGWNHFYEDGLGNYTQQTTPQLVSVGAGAGGCLNPTGSMGTMIYNAGTYHVLQYCDGSVWQPMGKVPGAGGGGCAAPPATAVEGNIIYNSAYRVIQYCDGTTWRAAGRTIPITGLVGWWNFDEGSGTSAADSSGGGNTGTLTGGASWTTGKINAAIVTDGSSGVVTSANITNPSTMSIAFWMKTTTPGTVSLVALSWGYYWVCGIFGGVTAVSGAMACDDNGNIGNGVDSNAAINDGNWHHFVFTATATTQTLYVDGVLNSTTSAYAMYLGFPPYPVIVGGSFGGGNYFPATFDDVRVYNRALSASEIWRLYNGAP